jgi:hypothetical protein
MNWCRNGSGKEEEAEKRILREELMLRERKMLERMEGSRPTLGGQPPRIDVHWKNRWKEEDDELGTDEGTTIFAAGMEGVSNPGSVSDHLAAANRKFVGPGTDYVGESVLGLPKLTSTLSELVEGPLVAASQVSDASDAREVQSLVTDLFGLSSDFRD